MSDEKEREDIKISDHRRFNQDGTERGGEVEEEKVVRQSPSEENKPPQSSQKNAPEEEGEVNFASFILSLAGSVQMSLGISPNPFTGKIERDLRQAKQTIDLIGVLSEKTKGNLGPEEAQLLEVILSDLRLRYVEEKNKK